MVNTNILTIFKDFGREGGNGADSIVKAAMFATGAAKLAAVTESDAAELYAAYREGFDAEAHYADKLIGDDKLKVQVSCFRTFLKAEVVRNGEIHERALKIRAKIDRNNRKHSTYNGLVALNRLQIKNGMKPLTDAQIRECLEKEDVAPKSEIEKLEALVAKLQKIDDAVGGLIEPIAQIERRIQRLKEAALKDQGADDEEDKQDSPPENNELLALLEKTNASAALAN